MPNRRNVGSRRSLDAALLWAEERQLQQPTPPRPDPFANSQRGRAITARRGGAGREAVQTHPPSLSQSLSNADSAQSSSSSRDGLRTDIIRRRRIGPLSRSLEHDSSTALSTLAERASQRSDSSDSLAGTLEP